MTGGRNQDPFRKKRESEQLSMPEENRLVISGMIEDIENLQDEVQKLKKRVEELENDGED